MASRNYTEIKGWTYVSGPGWWTGEDAMWIRQTKDGKWIVLKFCDLLDAGGKDFEDTPYMCDVTLIDFDTLSKKDVEQALASCGLKFQRVDERTVIVSDHGDIIEHMMECQVECLVSYGYGAPLHNAMGRRWLNVRADARRVAEALLRDERARETALDRPVNMIGSTAREYGAGDLDAAMDRMRDRLARPEPEAPSPADESTCTFATLHPDGRLTDERRIKHSDMRKCPHAILVPSHYRQDGSCKCDDPAEQKRLIKTSGYKLKDFKGIPLRLEVSHGSG